MYLFWALKIAVLMMDGSDDGIVIKYNDDRIYDDNYEIGMSYQE